MRTVVRIALAPVKGLGLAFPDAVELSARGIPGDRRLHLVDVDGRLVNGKQAPALLAVGPEIDGETLVLRLPSGETVSGEIAPGEPVVTDFYGRAVPGRVVAGPCAAALSELAGRRLRLVLPDVPQAALDRDAGVSLQSDGALAALARRAGVGSVDGRRFRMNLEVAGCSEHEEDGWIGGRVRAGAAELHVLGPVGRCAVTTYDPDRGVADLDTVRLLDGYRTLREGRSPALGVVAAVVVPGGVRLGDAVEPSS